MDVQGIVGLFVFWFSLLAFCVFLVVKTKRVVVSAIFATMCAALLIQIVSLLHLGYFEPFYQLAFVFSILMGLPVAFAVALLTRRHIRRRELP